MTESAFHLFYPAAPKVTPLEVGAKARQACLLPLSRAAVSSFCADLSQRLLTDPRSSAFPDCAAFGFWLRPASLQGLLAAVENAPQGTRRRSLGVAFFMPPANVATLFAYVGVLALLCGNAVVVRLSSAPSPAQAFLCDMWRMALDAADPALRARVFLVGYGHDDAITTMLSSVCDIRMVWGADATVAHLRALPLPALARQEDFGDRFSSAALSAAAYRALPEATRDAWARRLAVDVFSFDQRACSSPRALFWVGAKDEADESARDFYPRLAEAGRVRGFSLDIGAAILRRNAAFLALHDFETRFYETFAQTLCVVGLCNPADLPRFQRVGYGFGLLLDAIVPDLETIAQLALPMNQTLVLDGLAVPEKGLEAYDRIAPLGQATDFDMIWDGRNLIDLLSRFQRVIP